jgi:hypothetical protein
MTIYWMTYKEQRCSFHSSRGWESRIEALAGLDDW